MDLQDMSRSAEQRCGIERGTANMMSPRLGGGVSRARQ